MTTAQTYRIVPSETIASIERGTVLCEKVSREAQRIAYRWDHLPRELRGRLAAEIENALPKNWPAG
jgi:hypothetical protein